MKLIKHVTMLGLFACAAFAIAAEEKKADLKCRFPALLPRRNMPSTSTAARSTSAAATAEGL